MAPRECSVLDKTISNMQGSARAGKSICVRQAGLQEAGDVQQPPIGAAPPSSSFLAPFVYAIPAKSLPTTRHLAAAADLTQPRNSGPVGTVSNCFARNDKKAFYYNHGKS